MDYSFTDNVFSLKNNEFYTFIEELVGQQIVDVLKFQFGIQIYLRYLI